VREPAWGTTGTGVRPYSALAPREVVRAVIIWLRDWDCEAALRFVGEPSGEQGRGWTVVRRWVLWAEFGFLPDVRSLFVAPHGKRYGAERWGCKVSRVVNDSGGRCFFRPFARLCVPAALEPASAARCCRRRCSILITPVSPFYCQSVYTVPR
jgi:hypothetical protein